MNKYSIDCIYVTNESKGCGANGQAKGYELGPEFIGGMWKRKWRNVPAWKCPRCGKTYQFSYSNLTPEELEALPIPFEQVFGPSREDSRKKD